MNPLTSSPSLPPFLPRTLIPLAALAAMASYAFRELDPAGAAESGYLAVLSTAVLLAAAALALRRAPELGLGAVLATAAVWALPPGPARGSAVVLVLAATLAVAAVRRLARTLPDLPPAVAIPLCLGLQFLLRSDLLFTVELNARTLVALLALPAAAGAALSLLASRFGGLAAVTAGAVVLLLAPGWNVAATLGVIALAAGGFLARRDLSWPARGAALAVLLAPLAWEPWTGAAAAVSGLAVGFPVVAGVLGLLFVAGKLTLAGLAPAAVPDSPDGLVWPFFFVPELLLAERSRIFAAVAVAMVAATVPHVPDASALSAPLALCVLFLRTASLRLQRVWAGILLAATALLSSYPWLRPSLAEEILGRPHGGLDWTLGVLLLPVVFLLVGLALGVLGRGALGRRLRPEAGSAASAGLAALAFAGLVPFVLPAGTLLTAGRTVLLDASRPVWETSVPPGPVQALVIESSLSNSSPLAPDTTVATVRLVGAGGPGTSWPLRIGRDTGEWAARRADVERQSRSRAPEPWVSWVAGDFLAQRYRSRHDLAAPERAARLRIERAPGLPADLVIALHGVEVRQ